MKHLLLLLLISTIFIFSSCSGDLSELGKVTISYDNEEEYSIGSFSKEMNLSAIIIDWVSGSIKINYSEDSTMVKVSETSKTLLDKKRKLHYLYQDSILYIEPSQAGEINFKNISKDLEITLPYTYLDEVKIDTVSSKINLNLETKKLELDTISGDILIKINQFEDLSINSVSSSAEIIIKYNILSEVDFDSVSGRLTNALQGEETWGTINFTSISGSLNLYNFSNYAEEK